MGLFLVVSNKAVFSPVNHTLSVLIESGTGMYMGKRRQGSWVGSIVVDRVSAASTTARWSGRVDSTEHPESRSYLSENSDRYGSLTGL